MYLLRIYGSFAFQLIFVSKLTDKSKIILDKFNNHINNPQNPISYHAAHYTNKETATKRFSKVIQPLSNRGLNIE